jgi:hyperosmotically inducible protein
MSKLDHSRPWLLAALLGASLSGYAANPPASTSPPAKGSMPADTANTDPANTRVNKRDADTNAPPTADNQSNQQPDIRTAADVRKAIVDDKSLSVQAHKVKVLASSGVVTLRGPVKSADEKKRIEQLAKNVQGVTSVKNELESETKTQ